MTPSRGRRAGVGGCPGRVANLAPVTRRPSVWTVLGELVLTLGVITLLFAAYEAWGTDWLAAREQDSASAVLDEEWREPPADPAAPGPAAPVPGRPFLRMYVPAFASDYRRTVLEGVDQETLAAGPGHYPGSAVPGQPGNVAIAGHRVGHGAPFDAVDELRSCDAIVLETRDAWWVYRVLPMAAERAEWANREGSLTRCDGVDPLGDPYVNTVGREVVLPTRTEVVAPVPYGGGVAPTASLLTLTTCHPRFSDRERLIVHAVLVANHDKAGRDGGWQPPELAEA